MLPHQEHAGSQNNAAVQLRSCLQAQGMLLHWGWREYPACLQAPSSPGDVLGWGKCSLAP